MCQEGGTSCIKQHTHRDIRCASGGRTLAARRSVGKGTVGMHSRLFLKMFPSETGSEEKARRRKWGRNNRTSAKAANNSPDNL